MNSTQERVSRVLENMVLQGYEITADSTFEDIGLDSCDKVELIMDLEDEFLIDIPDEVSSYIDTYGELIEYINRRLAG